MANNYTVSLDIPKSNSSLKPYIVDWATKQASERNIVAAQQSRAAAQNTAGVASTATDTGGGFGDIATTFGNNYPYNETQRMWQYVVGRLFSTQLKDKQTVLKAMPAVRSGVEGAEIGTNMVEDIMEMSWIGKVIKMIASI